jgi:exosome complex component RRP41
MNGVTLALIDAGVAMNDFVCACSTGLVGEEPVLDLQRAEEKSGTDLPRFTIAVLPRTKRTIMVLLESRMHISKLDLLVDLAVEGAYQLHGILDTICRRQGTALLQKVEKINT